MMFGLIGHVVNGPDEDYQIEVITELASHERACKPRTGCLFKGSVSVASLRDRRVRCRVVTVWAAAPVHLDLRTPTPDAYLER